MNNDSKQMAIRKLLSIEKRLKDKGVFSNCESEYLNLCEIKNESINRYNDFNELSTFFSDLKFSFPQETVFDAKAYILLKLINDIHFTATYRSTLMKEGYNAHISRILNDIFTQSEPLALEGDNFWKELCLCKMAMQPTGPLLIEGNCCLSAKLLYKSNFQQAACYLKFLIPAILKKKFYQFHAHEPTINQLNKNNYIKNYIAVAEALEYDNKTKGVFGKSWFFDPRIKQISPHLSYLQDIPLSNGAYIYFSGRDTSGDATKTSRKRRQLQNNKEYEPKSYTMIWSRDSLIQWKNTIN